jgi:putative hydroxymethylpyrimidine transport system substrate-binding protein
VGMVAAFLVGCGGETSAETTQRSPREYREIEITIDGYSGPENVGILMAHERDYFEEVGLKVFLHTPIGPLRPIPYVVQGEVDLSVSHEPEVVLAQERGAPIIAIASLVPEPTAAIIWLKESKVGEVSDLKGKTIAIAGLPYEKALLESTLAQAGLTLSDVKLEVVEYELVPALVSGRADAIFGGSWNVEGAELESRGLEPVVTRVQDLDVPDYEELVLVARRDRLVEAPELIRDFISAMERGTETAIEEPQAAATMILGSTGKRNRKAVEAGLEETLPLLSTSGEMSTETAEGLVDWMHEEGLVRQEPSASDLLTNDYLP